VDLLSFQPNSIIDVPVSMNKFLGRMRIGELLDFHLDRFELNLVPVRCGIKDEATFPTFKIPQFRESLAPISASYGKGNTYLAPPRS